MTHRITALTDRLLRLEYHPSGRFDERRSFVAWQRVAKTVTLCGTRVGTAQVFEHKGIKLHLDGEGPFTEQSLRVRFPLQECQAEWHPGMTPIGAVGGTTRTLDGTAGDPPVEPGILSLDGWALVDDSRTVRFGENGWIEPGADDGQDWYLFLHGHDFRGALADYIQLSGNPPLPPRAVMGTWWSRYWRYSDADLRQIVAEFRAHKFPLDVLVLDMDWHLAKDWSGYTWNRELFPNPADFLKWCHEEGLKVTLNLHPSNGVQEFEEDYLSFAHALGHPANGTPVPFCGTDPAYMEQYFRQLHHPREDEGVDFWWMDWQQGTVCGLPGLDPLTWLNHLHHKDHDRSDRRGVMLSRWGGLGGHRYPIQFSGDTHTRWETLASQVDFTAGSAASLAGWWSHDIGGHLQVCPPELFVRWFQWGALSPVLRLHSSNNPNMERRPWAYGEDVNAACFPAAQFRMRYFPLWVAASHRFYETGIAPLTPMWFDHPTAPEAHSAQAQAMLLDQVLIAPIVAPMQDGRAERTVWLPAGEWWDMQMGACYAGDQIILVQGGLERMPVFVRSGSVLPIDSRQRLATSDLRPDRLEFELWPGTGEATVVEDKGEGDGWQRGEIARTTIRQTFSDNHLVVIVGPTTGRFPGLPARRPIVFHLCCCSEPKSVAGVVGLEYSYSSDDHCLTVTLPSALIGDAHRIEIAGVSPLPKSPPIVAVERRVVVVPRYDRRLAQRSIGSALLIPPVGGGQAKVRWELEQGEVQVFAQDSGFIEQPKILSSPLSWNAVNGAARWRVYVDWEDGTSVSGQSAWDLYCGLGEWTITLLPANADLDPKTLTPDKDWVVQSYRRLRSESLLDGPCLWCDSLFARRFGRPVEAPTPSGRLQESTVKTLFHLAAVSDLHVPHAQEIKFRINGLAKSLRFALDGRELEITENWTPLINLSEGLHRLTVTMGDLDVAKSVRYFRMLKVYPYTVAGTIATGMGDRAPVFAEN